MAFAACPSHGPGVKMLRDWPIAKLIVKPRWYLRDEDDPAMTLALRQWCVWISIYPLSLCPMLGNSLCPAQAGSIWIRWGTCVSPETWRWGSWWIGTFWTWDGHSDFEATDFQRKDVRSCFSLAKILGGEDWGGLTCPLGPKLGESWVVVWHEYQGKDVWGVMLSTPTPLAKLACWKHGFPLRACCADKVLT